VDLATQDPVGGSILAPGVERTLARVAVPTKGLEVEHPLALAEVLMQVLEAVVIMVQVKKIRTNGIGPILIVRSESSMPCWVLMQ